MNWKNTLLWIAWPSLFAAATIRFDSEGPSLTQIFAYPLLILWVFSLFARGGLRRPRAFHIFFLLYTFWNALTLTYSISPDLGQQNVLRFLPALALSWMFWDLGRTRRALLGFVVAFCGALSVASLTVIFNYMTGNLASMDRFSASGFDVNDLAVALGLLIPLAWHYACFEKRLKAPWRVLLTLYPFIALIGIVLTASRGGFVAALPGIFCILSTLPSAKWPHRAGFAVVGFAGLVVLSRLDLSKQIERIRSALTSGSTDRFSGRLDAWLAGLQSFQAHPIEGIGSGGFSWMSSGYGVDRGPNGLGIIAHNTFLEVVVESGVIGLVFFVGAWASVFLAIRKIPSKLERRAWFASMLTLSIGFLSLAYEARSQTWMIMAVAMIACYAQSEKAEVAQDEERRVAFAEPALSV